MVDPDARNPMDGPFMSSKDITDSSDDPGYAIRLPEVVAYTIEGALDGRPWVTYAPNAGDTEDDAVAIFEAWQKQRDAQEFEVRYRLVKCVTVREVLRDETSGEV